jgi:nicotinamidase-related amidase
MTETLWDDPLDAPPVKFVNRSGYRSRMKDLLEMDPASTVVITVDMQRDYLDLDIATAPLSAEEARWMVDNTQSLLDALRPAGIPVIHAYVKRRVIEHEHSFAGNAFSRAGQNARLSQNANAPARSRWDRLEDSVESDVVGRLLRPGDVHVTTKKTMDCFHGTDLEILLARGLKPKTIILTGINTDTCVYSTAFSAANRGYQVVLASDCTASMRGADRRWMAMELISGSLGWVISSAEILDVLGVSLSEVATAGRAATNG